MNSSSNLLESCHNFSQYDGEENLTELSCENVQFSNRICHCCFSLYIEKLRLVKILNSLLSQGDKCIWMGKYINCKKSAKRESNISGFQDREMLSAGVL